MLREEQEVTIAYGKIPNGTYDIARYLGIDPEKSIFYHSTSFDPTDKAQRVRWAINTGNLLYAETIVLTPDFTEGAPKSAICHYNQRMLDYYDHIGLTSKGNLVQVGVPDKTGFPYNSVSYNLNERLESDSKLRRQLDGFTFVSSYLSKWDEKNADLVGGRILMDPSHQETFNSKFYSRKRMEEASVSTLLPGACVTGVENLANALDELRHKMEELGGGQVLTDVKVWVKLENQSGGTGTMPFADLLASEVSVEQCRTWLYETGGKIFDRDYIEHDMRFVMEADAGCLPGEDIVGEFNVQAVITEGKVVLVGSAYCEADESTGKFIGNYIGQGVEYDKLKTAAETAVIRPFSVLCQEGYRGYMTNDVIVTRNTTSGAYRGWCIDPNARFAASTVLVRGVHKAEEELSHPIYGTLFCNSFPSKRGEWMAQFDRLFGSDMVTSKQDHLLGITPTLLCDVNSIGDDIWMIKSMCLATEYGQAREMLNGCKKRLWQAREAQAK